MPFSDSDPIPFADPSSTPAPTPRPLAPTSSPKLASQPMWQAPPEVEGRGWLLMLVFLGMIGLYAWTLSFFYAGAHGGVDQAGYLMTARLITGDKNVFAPLAPAHAEVTAPTTAPANAPSTEAATRTTTTLPASGYDAHPAPSAIQTSATFDAVRNRISFVPETPFQFVSRMCIMTEPYGPADPSKPAQYRIYAKYPFGFPLLAAIGRWLGGINGMYVINPLCTVLACYFAYFLFRQAVSPFISLIGVFWLATNPLVFNYANDANSHASTLFCVTLGFWGVLSWLRTQQNWRAWIGGFALGYACTIRYSEFLLVLPVLFAAMINLKRDRHRLWGSIGVICGWAIPVAVLAFVCWVSFGAPWKTGYTYCRESTGFAWKYLSGDYGDGTPGRGNWETFLTQLNHTGLFMLWPLAIAGIFAMLGSTWRLGGLIALWVIPASVLYMLYYWAPGGENTVGYLRFFMSVMPGMIFAGLWVLERGLSTLNGDARASLVAATLFGLFVLVAAALYVEGGTVSGVPGILAQIGISVWHLASTTWWGMAAVAAWLLVIAGMWLFDGYFAASRTGVALGAGILTALGCSVNLYNIVPQVENFHARWTGLRLTLDNVREAVPKGSVLVGEPQMLNPLDCIGGWKLIDGSLFSPSGFVVSKMRVDRTDRDKDGEEDPDPIQLERARFYVELLGKQNLLGNWMSKPATELQRLENELIDRNLDEGRRVMFLRAVVGESGGVPGGRTEIPTRPGYIVKEIRRWKVPVVEMPATRNQVAFNRFGNPRPQPGARRVDSEFALYEMVRKPATTTTAVEPTTKSPTTARTRGENRRAR